jgi:hypothetical protein
LGITLSLSEIVNKACALKAKSEKIEWLQANDSHSLKNLLVLMYDKERFQFDLPDTAPPYQPSEYPDSQGMLYKELRKMKYFLAGSDMNITRVRREQLFIQMLESIDKHDAILLCKVISQKPMKGLTKAVINAAFGDIIRGKVES